MTGGGGGGEWDEHDGGWTYVESSVNLFNMGRAQRPQTKA